MTRDDLINRYFEWMYDLVYDDDCVKNLSYRKLLYFLHATDFTYIIAMDANRESDGINLRYRFGRMFGFEDALIASYLDDRPCSVLEMMIALSMRCEEQIMDDPTEGNRLGEWFWNMIVSLGLGGMSDDKFDKHKAQRIINKLLNREYQRDGKGGLFTVEHTEQDMRTVEIWYQLCWYLDEYLSL